MMDISHFYAAFAGAAMACAMLLLAVRVAAPKELRAAELPRAAQRASVGTTYLEE